MVQTHESPLTRPLPTRGEELVDATRIIAARAGICPVFERSGKPRFLDRQSGERPRIAASSIPEVAYSSCDPTANPLAGLVTSTLKSLTRL